MQTISLIHTQIIILCVVTVFSYLSIKIINNIINVLFDYFLYSHFGFTKVLCSISILFQRLFKTFIISKL